MHTEHRFKTILELNQSIAEFVAQRLCEAIALRGTASLVVPGGRTPGGALSCLSKQDLAWGRVTVTLSDERCVSESNADSNAALVRHSLLQGAASAATFIPLHDESGTSPEASAYLASEALAAIRDDFDVVILGMGEDGHTASIFPDSPQLAAALADDAPDCIAVEASKPPPQRLTLSARRLRNSRCQILLITGTEKMQAFDAALAPQDTRSLPIRMVLQGKSETHVFWAP